MAAQLVKRVNSIHGDFDGEENNKNHLTKEK